MRLLLLFFALSCAVLAQSPSDVRPVPPPGVAIPEAARVELIAGVAALGKEIDELRASLAGKPELLALLPDVMIFHKSVDWALRYDEFFDPKQVAIARHQLALGMERAKELRAGRAPWNAQTGLVPRGYISRIDGSVQPYGLVIPDSWKPGDKTPRRLDFWCHGRSEKLSELDFINQRMTNKGEFTPEGAFVLHLYGRYCCANKFAGEVDLFEALDNAARHYPIDMRRLVVRGFSMGGASAWQFGTHFAGQWAAVAPGAGFGETAEFFNVFAEGKTPPPWWEQVLWRWYDSTLYAANLFNTTTVAYSGEIDKQKQAADIMIRFLKKEGLTIPHIIGPQTAHKIHPDAKPKIEELVKSATDEGSHAVAERVRFTTYSLIYPAMKWLRVDGLEKHWERTDIVGEVIEEGLLVQTRNVSAFTVTLPATGPISVRANRIDALIDGQKVSAPYAAGGSSFHKAAGQWKSGPAQTLRGKTTKVCGPIDHAFMSRFVFVRPTGKPLNPAVGAWVNSELAHATDFWRKVFRGDAPVKDDNAITDDDIKNANLILWGDPSSNKVLAKILGKLPLKWDAKTLEFRGYTLDAAHHAPALIFPNPLNPQNYVVLNSGPTFREEANLNNSDQTPKLPDWAIVDLRTPPGPRAPGLIIDAGFFDEHWH